MAHPSGKLNFDESYPDGNLKKDQINYHSQNLVNRSSKGRKKTKEGTGKGVPENAPAFQIA